MNQKTRKYQPSNGKNSVTKKTNIDVHQRLANFPQQSVNSQKGLNEKYRNNPKECFPHTRSKHQLNDVKQQYGKICPIEENKFLCLAIDLFQHLKSQSEVTLYFEKLQKADFKNYFQKKLQQQLVQFVRNFIQKRLKCAQYKNYIEAINQWFVQSANEDKYSTDGGTKIKFNSERSKLINMANSWKFIIKLFNSGQYQMSKQTEIYITDLKYKDILKEIVKLKSTQPEKQYLKKQYQKIQEARIKLKIETQRQLTKRTEKLAQLLQRQKVISEKEISLNRDEEKFQKQKFQTFQNQSEQLLKQLKERKIQIEQLGRRKKLIEAECLLKKDEILVINKEITTKSKTMEKNTQQIEIQNRLIKENIQQIESHAKKMNQITLEFKYKTSKIKQINQQIETQIKRKGDIVFSINTQINKRVKIRQEIDSQVKIKQIMEMQILKLNDQSQQLKKLLSNNETLKNSICKEIQQLTTKADNLSKQITSKHSQAVKIQSLKQQKNKLLQSIASAQSRIGTLQCTINQKTWENQQLASKVKDISAALEQQIFGLEVQIGKLRSENIQSKQVLTQYTLKLQQYSVKFQKQKELKDILNNKNGQLTQKCNKYQQDQQNREKLNKSLLFQNNSLKQKIKALQLQTESLKSQIQKSLSQENAENLQIQSMKQQIEKQSIQFSALQNYNSKLIKQKDQLNKNIQMLRLNQTHIIQQRDRNNDSGRFLETAKKQLEKLQNENKKLNQEKSIIFNSKLDIQKQNLSLKKQNQSLQQRIKTTLQPKIKSLKQQNSNLVSHKNAVELQIEAMKQQIKEQSFSVLAVGNQNNDLIREKQYLQKEISRLKFNSTQMIQQRDKNPHLVRSLETENKQIERLQNEKNRLSQQNTHIFVLNSNLQIQNQNLKEQNQLLQQTTLLPQIESLNQRITSSVEAAKGQLQIFESENKKLSQKNYEILTKNTNLEIQIEQLNNKIQLLRKDNSELLALNNNFKSQQMSQRQIVENDQFTQTEFDNEQSIHFETIRKLEEEVYQLAEKLKNQQSTSRSNEQQIKKLNNNIKNLYKQKINIQRELSILITQKANLQGQIIQKGNIIGDKSILIEEFQQKNRKLQTELAQSREYQGQVNNLASEIRVLKQRVNEANVQRKILADTSKRAIALQSQVKKLKIKQNDAISALEKVKNEAKVYQQNMREQERKNKQLNQTILQTEKNILKLEAELDSKQTKNKYLQNILAEKDQNIGTLNMTIKELESQVNSLLPLQQLIQRQSKDAQLIINYQIRLQQATIKFDQLKQLNQNQSQTIQNLSKSLDLALSENQKLTKSIKKGQPTQMKEINELKCRITEKQGVVEELQNSNKQLFNNMQFFKERSLKLEVQKSENELKRKQLSEDKERLEKLLKEKDQKSNLSPQYTYKNRYTQPIKNYEKLQADYNQLKIKYDNIKPSNLLSQVPSSQKQKKELADAKKELNSLKNKVSNQQQKIKAQQMLLADRQQQIQYLHKKNQQLKSNSPTIGLPGSMDNLLVKHLFHGNTLRGRDDHKQYLKKIIQKQIRQEIVDTSLVYTYDGINLNNFHRYIDQKSHLVLLVKLINGFYVACYYQGMLKPKAVSDKLGLIVSLTNRKYYIPKERNKRAVCYDNFFLIFGNSEFRLKSQETKVFSNFGINASYYQHFGDPVSTLLGEGKERELDLESYEFHQLILKQ